MKVGDIVEREGLHRQVLSFNRQTKTVRASDEAGRVVTLANDDPEWRVLHNPPSEWPFVTVPTNRKPIHRVVFRSEDLRRFVQWATPDVDSRGGPLYLHPDLGLRPHDMLTVYYRTPSPSLCVRVKIPRNFGTVSQRVQRAQQVPREPLTAFDHLLEEEDD